MTAPIKPTAPQNPILDIDLRQTAKSGAYDPPFVAEMLSLDVNGDGHLRDDDLVSIFGNSSKTDIKDLYESIQNKDYDKFQDTTFQMAKGRNSLFATSVREAYEHAEKFGIKKDSAREEVAKILARKLSETYMKEFGEVVDQDRLAKTLEHILSGSPPPMEPGTGTIDLIGSRLGWDKDIMLRRAEASAWKVYNDYTQPDYVTNLEQLFNINIRFNELDPSGEQKPASISPQEAFVLQGALTFIQVRRPEDLQLLKTLNLTISARRDGAEAKEPRDGSIYFNGPFGKPDGALILRGYYALESQYSMRVDEAGRYIAQLFGHELGHLVAARDNMNADEFAVPADYGRLLPIAVSAPGSPVANEWFSEDYNLYLQSNGKRVMKTTVDGRKVLNYAKRLIYFQSHYPLRNKTR